jgi:hypothetical protein
MEFDKPDMATLESERDVELKFLYPLMVSETPSGLGFDPVEIKAQKNLRKFSIGKGSDQKSYFPDYLVTRGTIPLMVVEGKRPDSDVLEAFRVIPAKPRAWMHYFLVPARESPIQAMCEPTGRP